MPEDLEAAFHQKGLEIYATAKRECRYNATRFLQKIRKDGGLRAAKAWLRAHSSGDKPAQGFLKLLDYGRLDISLTLSTGVRWAAVYGGVGATGLQPPGHCWTDG